MNFNTFQSRRKLVIVGVILFVLVLIISLLVYLNSRGAGKLVSSDTLLTNLQSMNIVRDQDHKASSLYFFTGSNVAEVNTLDIKNSSSKAILKEYPYTNTEATIYNPDTSSLLVRVDPGYIDSMPGISNSSGSENLTAWLLQTKDSKPQLVDVGRPIIDASFINNQLALLTYSEESNQLVLYNIKDKKSKVIIKSTDSNKIIGVFKDSIYLRNSSGSVHIVNAATGNIKSEQITGNVTLDQETGYLISGKSKTLQIYSNESKFSVDTEYSNYFVTNGYIVELNSNNKPSKIRVYSLEKREWVFNYDIDNSKNNSIESISSIHLLNHSPLTLLVIKSDETGYLISKDSGYINSLPMFKFPKQETIEKDTFIYDYDIGSNTVIFISNKSVESTLPIISSACECNPNSIRKDWRPVNENKNTDSEDYFTGDGLPPEERVDF